MALVGWNICVGTVRIPLADIFASIRGEKLKIQDPLGYPNAKNFSGYDLRRCFGTCRVSVADFFFLNPIAGPFVLGISSGAKNGGGTRHGISDGTGSKKDHFLGIDRSSICRGNDLYGICALNVTQSP